MAEKVVRRLGERLDHVFRWVGSADSYDFIWDLCCDHGRLGLHLHKSHPNTYVYLVDKVAAIVDKLATDYSELNDGRLHFKTADVCQLNIATEKRTLVIVAGVGGQNLITMLEGLLARLGPEAAVDFILSPNSHMFELRAFLQSRPFTLIDEAFVTEKGFSHEHLWLRYSNCSNGALAHSEFKSVSAVGYSLWHDMTDIKRVYICKLQQHYQRMLDYRYSEISDAALKAYGEVLKAGGQRDGEVSRAE